MKPKNTLQRLVTLLCLVALLAALGVSITHAQNVEELNFGISNNVDTLDPNVTTFSSVGIIMAHVFDPLIWQDPLGTFHAGLATEWSVNSDATEYTFKLRNDVKFHDGTPFNAQAVKFTFDRIANPDTKSQTALSLLGPYKETKIVDDYTVTVVFNSPFAPFLDSVSQPYLAPTSPDAVQKMGADYGQKSVVGTGPFKLESYTPDSEVVLVRNDDYNWGPKDVFGQSGPAGYSKITFKIIQEPATRLAALESGDVNFINDVPETDVDRLSQDSNYKMIKMEQPGSGWSLMMNVQNPPTDDVQVRKAIALASDKQGMIDTAFNGLGSPGCGPLTKTMFGFDKASCDYLPHDPTQAAKILDDDGWKLNASTGIREKDGKPLVIQHYYRADNPLGAAMATFMKADLAKVGIDVELNGLAQAGYFDAVRSGKHNTQNWWETATDPDVVRILFYSANADGGTNRNRYKNPAMDKLIDQAAGTTDAQERVKLYAQIQKLAADDAIMVFYNDPLLLYAHTVKLDGVKYLAGGNIPDFYASTLSS
jgi:peptide/nickel transport system substrate-binding protein